MLLRVGGEIVPWLLEVLTGEASLERLVSVLTIMSLGIVVAAGHNAAKESVSRQVVTVCIVWFMCTLSILQWIACVIFIRLYL